MAEPAATTTTGTEAAKVSDWTSEAIRQFDAEQYLPEAVQPVFQLLAGYPVLLVLIFLVLGFLAGKGIQFVLRTSLRRLAQRTRTTLDESILKALLAPVLQTTVILSLVLSVRVLALGDTVEQVLIRLLLTALLFFWARAWFRATNRLLPVLSEAEGRFQVLQPRTVPLFEMGIKLFLVSIFVWFLMALWGIDGTAWLASAGVVGIAVGFAARDTLANLISGVSIVADAPYKIGDYIVLDSGERGIVTGLGMRSTRLLTRDDVEISIPNAVMGNAKISNESSGRNMQYRIRIPVGVAYGTDTGRVVSLLENIAKENPMILENPAPRVRMRGFGDSSLDFELLGWISNPEQRGLVIHQLLMAIDKCFRQEEITIPFPQRDVHLVSEGPQARDAEPAADHVGLTVPGDASET
jgi:small-conductance mechanosensitive channel